MGKGNRSSQKRLQDQAANSEKYLEQQKKQSSKKKSDRAIAITCIVFAVLIVGVLVLNVLSESGVFIRGEAAVSQGDVVVDSAMMSFFFNDYILGWYNENYQYMSYFSVDFSYDLHDQIYGKGLEVYFGEEFDGTWYDYFLEKVMSDVERYVTCASAAKAAGMKLDAEDNEDIDEIIENIKASLKQAKVGYSDWYGKGVGEGDVRRAYELIYLASKYSEDKQDKLEQGMVDKNVTDYVAANKKDFYTADYRSYKISLNSKNFDNTLDFDKAVAEAKATAEKIAASKTPEEFLNIIKEYEASQKKPETTTSTSTGTTAATTEPSIEKYEGTISYETDDAFGKWIFDETIEEGAYTVIEETGTETEKATTATTEKGTTATTEKGTTETETGTSSKKVYKTYTVTAYQVLKPSHLDTSLTKDLAFVISDKKADVEAFRNEFVALKDKNTDKFNELAQKKYDKLHEGHDHTDANAKEPVFNFSVAEKAPNKYFSDAYDVINKWLDTGKLEKNMVSEIMEITVDKETYYAVVYFEEYQGEVWYEGARSGYVSQEFDAWYKAELDKKLIKYNNIALDNINNIILNTGSQS